ncbi:MAG: hypothetical protein KDK70_17200 [Myxococcales bacterium]|nr:hypothetical protein [Myxococcales bacterium]
MSDLLSITAVDVDKSVLILKIVIVHGDVDKMLETKNYILQILWDAGGHTARGPRSPLRTSLSAREALNPFVMTACEDEYIESVETIETNCVRIDGYDATLWTDEGVTDSSYATMKITLTDAKWAAHIARGDRWASAAYDMYAAAGIEL